MKSLKKSRKKIAVDIGNYYAISIKSLWNGVRQENASFWWVCIYFFFEYVRPQNIYRWLDVLPFGLLSLLLATATALNDRSIKWVKSPANTPFITFYAIAFISCLFAFNPSIAFDKIDVLITWVVAYFLIISVVNTEKKLFIFLLLFFLVNFKMSQHGFITWAQRGFGYAEWGVSGSPGWFQNAGDFGIQMIIFTTLSTAFIIALRDRWNRYVAWIFYLLPFTGFMSILASASRGCQIGIVASAVWVIMKSRYGIKAILSILLVGVIVHAMLPDKMFEEYDDAGDDYTSVARITMWSYGMEVLKDNPVLGVGYHNWYSYCWYENPNGFWVQEHFVRVLCVQPHNTHVDALVETGIVGFTAFWANIIMIFVLNHRTRKNADQTNNKLLWFLSHGLDAGLVGIIVATMFFSILWYPMYWIQLAIAVVINELSKKSVGNKNARRFKSS